MWNIIQSIDQIPELIEVQLNYYRKSDHACFKEALRKSPRKLPPAKGEIVKIPKTEFLAYWLFEDKDPNHPLAKDFEALARNAANAIPDLSMHFEVSETSIRAFRKSPDQERPPDIPTRLGVSIGLSVVNQLIGTTRADWNKIDRTRNEEGKEEPRFDYDLAGTDVGFVAVENKGGIVSDNTRISPTVSRRKGEIVKGMDALRPSYGSVPLIGTIGVADSREDSRLKCWLLDPPIPKPEKIDSEVYRIARRLEFQRSLMRFVFPRWKALDFAIEERTKAILAHNEWEQFQDLALKRPQGGKFRLKWEGVRKVQTRAGDRLWVGVIRKCRPGYLLYIAMEHHWASAVVEQELSRLKEMGSPSRTEEVVLQWQATNRERGLLIGTLAEFGKTFGRRTPVKLPATLYQTSGGLAFALIEKKRRIIRPKP